MRTATAQRRADAPLRDTRHEIFLKIIDLLGGYEGQALKDLADEAGVHFTTIYNWQRGDVFCPQFNKVAAVAVALGYTLVLKHNSNKPVLRRVK